MDPTSPEPPCSATSPELPPTQPLRKSAPNKLLGHFVCTPAEHIDRIAELAEVGRDDFVLDIGSGDGSFLRNLHLRTKCRGLGVEIAEAKHMLAIQSCKELVQQKVLSFLKGAAEDLQVDAENRVRLSGCGGRAWSEKVPVTKVYVYQCAIAHSAPIIKLLQSLLNGGVPVVTHEFLLPAAIQAMREKSSPDISSEAGLAGVLGQSTAFFYRYRGLTALEQGKLARLEDIERKLAELRGLSDEVAWQSPAPSLGGGMAFCFSLRPGSPHLRVQRTPRPSAKSTQSWNQDRMICLRFERRLEEKFKEVLTARDCAKEALVAHAESTEQRRLRHWEEELVFLKEEWATRRALEEQRLDERNAEDRKRQARQEIQDADLSVATGSSWECASCRSNNADTTERCVFCDGLRLEGTSLCSWAASEAPWETADRTPPQWIITVPIQSGSCDDKTQEVDKKRGPEFEALSLQLHAFEQEDLAAMRERLRVEEEAEDSKLEIALAEAEGRLKTWEVAMQVYDEVNRGVTAASLDSRLDETVLKEVRELYDEESGRVDEERQRMQALKKEEDELREELKLIIPSTRDLDTITSHM